MPCQSMVWGTLPDNCDPNDIDAPPNVSEGFYSILFDCDEIASQSSCSSSTDCPSQSQADPPPAGVTPPSSFALAALAKSSEAQSTEVSNTSIQDSLTDPLALEWLFSLLYGTEALVSNAPALDADWELALDADWAPALDADWQRLWKCPTSDNCKRTAARSDDWKRHDREMHGEELFGQFAPRLKCPFCPTLFKRASGLNKHVRKKHPEKQYHPRDAIELEGGPLLPKYQQCPLGCEVLFADIHSRHTHLKERHEDTYRIWCPKLQPQQSKRGKRKAPSSSGSERSSLDALHPRIARGSHGLPELCQYGKESEVETHQSRNRQEDRKDSADQTSSNFNETAERSVEDLGIEDDLADLNIEVQSRNYLHQSSLKIMAEQLYQPWTELWSNTIEAACITRPLSAVRILMPRNSQEEFKSVVQGASFPLSDRSIFPIMLRTLQESRLGVDVGEAIWDEAYVLPEYEEEIQIEFQALFIAATEDEQHFDSISGSAVSSSVSSSIQSLHNSNPETNDTSDHSTNTSLDLSDNGTTHQRAKDPVVSSTAQQLLRSGFIGRRSLLWLPDPKPGLCMQRWLLAPARSDPWTMPKLQCCGNTTTEASHSSIPEISLARIRVEDDIDQLRKANNATFVPSGMSPLQHLESKLKELDHLSHVFSQDDRGSQLGDSSALARTLFMQRKHRISLSEREYA